MVLTFELINKRDFIFDVHTSLMKPCLLRTIYQGYWPFDYDLCAGPDHMFLGPKAI